MKRYRELFKKLNYRCYEYPFQVLRPSLISVLVENTKKHKDALYDDKNILPGVDVILCNFMDKVIIMLVNVDLLK